MKPVASPKRPTHAVQPTLFNPRCSASGNELQRGNFSHGVTRFPDPAVILSHPGRFNHLVVQIGSCTDECLTGFFGVQFGYSALQFPPVRIDTGFSRSSEFAVHESFKARRAGIVVEIRTSEIFQLRSGAAW